MYHSLFAAAISQHVMSSQSNGAWRYHILCFQGSVTHPRTCIAYETIQTQPIVLNIRLFWIGGYALTQLVANAPCSTILIPVSGYLDIWFDADFWAWDKCSLHNKYVRISFGRVGQLYSIRTQFVALFVQPSLDWQTAMRLLNHPNRRCVPSPLSAIASLFSFPLRTARASAWKL